MYIIHYNNTVIGAQIWYISRDYYLVQYVSTAMNQLVCMEYLIYTKGEEKKNDKQLHSWVGWPILDNCSKNN